MSNGSLSGKIQSTGGLSGSVSSSSRMSGTVTAKSNLSGTAQNTKIITYVQEATEDTKGIMYLFQTTEGTSTEGAVSQAGVNAAVTTLNEAIEDLGTEAISISDLAGILT